MVETRIAVIGAGIIGLPSAYKILKDVKNCNVTVFSEDFSPDTTGDVSAGFIYPYKCKGDKIRTWFKLTLDHLARLYKLDDAYEMGIHPVSGYVFKDHLPYDVKAMLPYCQPITAEERSVLSVNLDEKLTTWTCDCNSYLPWLRSRIEEMGGKLVKRRIDNFMELKDFDVIVNCAGLGARKLTGDTNLYPMRGQIYVVKAPWISACYLSETAYILPRLDSVILGGTAQKNDYNLKVDSDDSQRIWRDCCELCPSIKYSEVIEEQVGLRPFRDPVRLELEMQSFDGRQVAILHNYGHGGGGVTLHWGCATDVSDIIQDYLRKNNLKSRM